MIMSSPNASAHVKWGLEAMEGRMASFRIGEELICPNPSYWLGQEASELTRMANDIRQATPAEEAEIRKLLPLLRENLARLSGWTEAMPALIQPLESDQVSLPDLASQLDLIVTELRRSASERPDEL